MLLSSKYGLKKADSFRVYFIMRGEKHRKSGVLFSGFNLSIEKTTPLEVIAVCKEETNTDGT